MRRRTEGCAFVHGHKRGVDRAENARVRHRCENGQCVAQPKQPQTIAVHQTTAEGVGNRMEAGGRSNILCTMKADLLLSACTTSSSFFLSPSLHPSMSPPSEAKNQRGHLSPLPHFLLHLEFSLLLLQVVCLVPLAY